MDKKKKNLMILKLKNMNFINIIFNMKMSNKNIFKTTFFKKKQLYFGLLKNLLKTVH